MGGAVEVEMPESFRPSFRMSQNPSKALDLVPRLEAIANRKDSGTTISCIDTICEADPRSSRTANTCLQSKIYGKWTSWLESVGVGKRLRTIQSRYSLWYIGINKLDCELIQKFGT